MEYVSMIRRNELTSSERISYLPLNKKRDYFDGMETWLSFNLKKRNKAATIDV
jgi:hypothetical protein